VDFVLRDPRGVRLEVTVVPKASRNAVLGEYQGRLKIALTAPPVDGQANEALIEFLAKLVHVPKRDLFIVRGSKGKRKSVVIVGKTLADLQGFQWI